MKACPGCPDCTAKDQRIAALEDTVSELRAENEILREDKYTLVYQISDLEAATRRVVEAAIHFNSYLDSKHPKGGVVADWITDDVLEAFEPLELLLADPVIVALRRE
jgi:hypothetical protein